MGGSNNALLAVISLFQFVAIAFLIIGSVTAPVFHQIGLSKFGGITYGTFGYCTQGDCSSASSNYRPFSLTDDPSAWNIDSNSRKSLGEILICMPIAAGINFLGFLTTIVTMFIVTSKSGKYTLPIFMINLLFGVAGFCITALICVVVFLLFYPHVTWCAWLLVPAAAVALLALPLQFWSYLAGGKTVELDITEMLEEEEEEESNKEIGEEVMAIPDRYDKQDNSEHPVTSQHPDTFKFYAPSPKDPVPDREPTEGKDSYNSSNSDVSSGAIYHSFTNGKETPPAIVNLTYQSSPSYTSSLLKEKGDIQVHTLEKPQSSATSIGNDNDATLNEENGTLNEFNNAGQVPVADVISKPPVDSTPVDNNDGRVGSALLPKFPVAEMANSPSLASSVYSQRNNYIEDHTTKGRILQDVMKEANSLRSSGSRSAAGSDSGSPTSNNHNSQQRLQQQQQQQLSPHYHPYRTHSTDTRLSNLTSISRRYGNPDMYQSNSQSNLSVKRQLQNTPYPQSSPSSTSTPQFTSTQQTSLRPAQGLRRSTPPHSPHNAQLPSPSNPAQLFADAAAVAQPPPAVAAVATGPSPSDMIIRNDPNFLAPSYNRTGTQKVRMNYQHRQQQIANPHNPYGNTNMILNANSKENLPAGSSHHYIPSYKRRHGYNTNKGSMMDEIRASGPYGIAHDTR